MATNSKEHAIVTAIRQSGVTIYDKHPPGLFIPNENLESILNQYLKGHRLNQPLRTRSKVVKSLVCQALGYSVPDSFKKTKPRFPGQNFDTYVQKANNLQIWNEDVSPSRRYVLIRVDADDHVTCVRVVSGEIIASLDTTGTLTQKFQAKSRSEVNQSTLVSSADTAIVSALLDDDSRDQSLMSIQQLFERLSKLTGTSIRNVGVDQERNRGGELHLAVSHCLGMARASDSGQFPDIPEQLLEIKLQTSPTIDLGLVCPNGTDPISNLPSIRHCDVRYSVFYGTPVGDKVRLDHVVVTTGHDFFSFFQRFGGKILNKKLQIPLPSRFFD